MSPLTRGRILALAKILAYVTLLSNLPPFGRVVQVACLRLPEGGAKARCPNGSETTATHVAIVGVPNWVQLRSPPCPEGE
jgi:hypothetical protein